MLSGCGGGGETDTSAPPPLNQAPVARIDLPSEAVAGQPAVFDASRSTDPEGAALGHTWAFGDGLSAGSAQVAHVYAQAGTYTVRLLVRDSAGATTEASGEVTVRAAPAATHSVPVTGWLSDIDGLPLAGVTARVEGDSDAAATAVSDADGRVSVRVGVGVNAVLRLSKPGYTDQVRAVVLPRSAGADAAFEARLMPRAAPRVLADADAGGEVTGPDGVRLTLPPAALVDAQTGAAVHGAVQVTMTPVDINGPAVAAFPGRFEGLQGDGRPTPLVSFGTTEFLLSQDGRALQLRPGSRALIRLPLYASQDLGGVALVAGGRLPLWSLDERSARWVQEDHGTLVADAAAPTGLALQAEVAHLSWWNADKGYTPYRPRPRCINDVPGQYDSIFEQATICKMLAEMDKPIPPQGGTARALEAGRRPQPMATAPRFPLPAFRSETDIAMADSQTVDLPPDQDVLLTGTALNGTWRGQLRTRGGEGASAALSIALRPVTSGGRSELITLPFDEVRAATTVFRTDTYRFQAAAGQDVALAIAADRSSLTGRIRLRDAVGVLLDAAAFDGAGARLQVRLPTAGEYRVEVEPGLGAPGAYRLQASFVTAQEPPAGTEGADIRAPMIVGHQGTLLALWVAPDAAGNPQLQARRAGAANPAWSTPRRLAPLPGQNPYASPQPQAVADGRGTAWVLWFDATNKVPMLTRGPIGTDGPWSEPLTIGSSTCRGTGVQRIAVNAAGQALVLWQRASATPGANNGWCSRRFEDGDWRAEQVIGPVTGQNFASGSLQLVLTDGAQAVAAWHQTGIAVPVVSQQDTATGDWSAPLVLDPTANDALPGGGIWSALSAGDDGSLLLTWRALEAGPARTTLVHAAVRPAGQPWSARIPLGTSRGDGLGYAQAAALGGGRHLVAWNDVTGGPQLREYGPTTGWTTPPPPAAGAAQADATLMWRLAADRDGTAAVLSQGPSASGAGTHLYVDLRDPASGTWRSLAPIPAATLVTGGYGPALCASAGWVGLAWTQTTAQGFQLQSQRLQAGP